MSMDNDERIRLLAYAIWEQSGSPHGRDQEFWFEAEHQLLMEGRLHREDTEHDLVRIAPHDPKEE